MYPLKKFFERIPPLENVVLQFKGPQMWVEQAVLPSRFHQLKRLFVANVPVEWDIFLLDAALVLETLHVHIDSSEKTNIGEVCKGVDAQYPQ